ncbi:unnamed protein product, partial [Thlaspi arvense]
HQLAAGSLDGILSVYDSHVPSASSSSSFTSTSKVRTHMILSGNRVRVSRTSLAKCSMFNMGFEKESKVVSFCVATYSDGYLRIFELLNPLELNNCQLQAEFQNVIDSLSTLGKPSSLSASVSWNPVRSDEQEPSFVLAFNSDSPHLNSSKIWEFDEAHNKWLAVAELALQENKGDPVYAVSWFPNIGRPYEVVAVATHRGIGIWHVGLAPDHDGRVLVKKAASLSGHQGELWQIEWEMSGMTLASTGSDGIVK